jgi:hypothetical protein
VTKRTQNGGVHVVHVALQTWGVATKNGDSFGNSPHCLALSLAFYVIEMDDLRGLLIHEIHISTGFPAYTW